MSDRPDRMVPRPPQATAGLLYVAEKEGWRFLEDEDPGSVGATASFALPDGTVAHWHEDEMTGLGYVTVDGPSAASVARVVRDHLDVLSPEEFADFVAKQPRARDVGHALYAVALATEGQPRDPDVERILLERLHDPDPTVRRYAALAASLVPWPALHRRIQTLAIDDEDAEVRETATLILEDLGSPPVR